jgi:hypothetical protein
MNIKINTAARYFSQRGFADVLMRAPDCRESCFHWRDEGGATLKIAAAQTIFSADATAFYYGRARKVITPTCCVVFATRNYFKIQARERLVCFC